MLTALLIANVNTEQISHITSQNHLFFIQLNILYPDVVHGIQLGVLMIKDLSDVFSGWENWGGGKKILNWDLKIVWGLRQSLQPLSPHDYF